MSHNQLVGIQGYPGANHEIAARQMHGPDVELAYIQTFEELFARLRAGEIGSVVVAIANVSAGFIDEPHDELIKHGPNYWITGETYVPVRHQLLGLPGSSLDIITGVHSMAPALQQCRHTLHDILPQAHLVEEDDTALSAMNVNAEGDITQAAIATKEAGEHNGLITLVSDIQDRARNLTRFIGMTLRPIGPVKLDGTETKTTILLEVPNKKGGLLRALASFYVAGINLATLHSSFVPDEDFNEQFLMEFDAGIGSRNARTAMKLAKKLGCSTKILGSYRHEDVPDTETSNI